MSKAARTSKLVKLRTYRDDLARVRGTTDVPNDTGTKTPVTSVITPAPQPEMQRTPAKVPVRVRLQQRTDESFGRIVPKKIPTSTVVPPQKPLETMAAPTPVRIESQPQPRSKPTPPLPVPPARQSVPQRDLPDFVKQDLEKIKGVRADSILSQQSGPFDVQSIHETGGEGTIVTDTKHSKQGLLLAIWTALTGWFGEKKEEYAEQRKPKYTVAPAEERKETIKRAATSGSLAPKDDYETVARRLRHVPRPPVTPPVLPVRPQSDVPEPSWSHLEGEQPQEEHVQPSPALPTIPNERVVAREVAAPEPEVYSPVLPPPSVPTPEPIVIPNVPQEAPAHEPAPTPESEPEPVDVKSQPVPVADTRNVRTSTVSSPSPDSFPAPRPRGSLLPIIIGGVLASLLGIGVSLWLFGEVENTTVPISQSSAPTLLSTSTTQPIGLGATRTQLINNLVAGLRASNQRDVTQLYPVTTTSDGATRAATTEEILTILDLRAAGGFLRTITNIGFGTYRGSEPFIIMHVSSFDVALGGMLLWEDSMSSDLAPFFGEPVTSTFDPLSRTATQTREPFFVDVVDSNRDLRVLYDGAGDERIVYTFLNRTTILISTDRTVIEEVTPLIR